MELKELIEKLKENNPKADTRIIKKAYEFAEKHHKDEKRASGERFIQHPLNTAYILAELNMDVTSIAAGLLHDVVENTETSLKELKKEFGDRTTSLVDGVTNLTRIKYHNKTLDDAENIRKMFMATTKDIRVLIIKLADKLHNMRTLEYLPRKERERIAQETLDIYAPLAYRLGIASIEWELEDISFKHLHPKTYEKFRKKFGKTREEREEEIKDIREVIEGRLKEHKIKAEITGRPKEFYSIYKKMILKQRTFEELHDLKAIRIITDSVKHCYEILGIVHNLWNPIHREFRDYIAMPKSNMYQSLHTTVIFEGEPLEIQIRTEEMHKTAEEGIAAHWKYKGIYGDEKFDQKLSWLKQILEWQRESQSTEEFMDFLKIDFFQDEIYVFTPKGEIVSLPRESTPIDFAYAVHSTIGDGCTGAIVNGRIVPLRYNLKNGDIIKILTSKNTRPHRDWLKIVKTAKAKSKIKQYIRKKEEIPIKTPSKKEPLRRITRKNLVEINDGDIEFVKYAQCCKPLPGDSIIGFLTRTNRAIIHKNGCKMLAKRAIKKKSLDVKWRDELNEQVIMRIIADDRVGLFADILNTIAATGTNVNPAKARMIGKDLVECDLGIMAENLDHVRDIIQRIRRIQSVRKVFIENK